MIIQAVLVSGFVVNLLKGSECGVAGSTFAQKVRWDTTLQDFGFKEAHDSPK